MDGFDMGVARRRQAEMRARAAEDHVAAGLLGKGGSMPRPAGAFRDRIARVSNGVRGQLDALRRQRAKM